MTVVVWIVTIVLALVFLAAGGLEANQSRKALQEKGLTWVEDFSDGQVKIIGALEVLGALGLVLPKLLDTAVILVPIAASGLALTMVGAVITHVRRGEKQEIVPGAVLGLLALFVAIMRFGGQSF